MKLTIGPAGVFRTLLFLLGAALAPACHAQSQAQGQAPSSARQFDVVSIKPSRPGAVMQDMRITFPPGRMEAVNITLKEMLLSFSGFSGQVEGGPTWVESQRYDIVGKADGEITPAERGAMVMAMLQDRFKLAVHHESREVPGLALVKGKKPPNLEAAKDGEKTLIHLDDQRRVIFQNVSMNGLAGYLRSMWGDPVVDRTGIAGNFDFAIEPNSFADVPGESFSARVRPAVEALGFRLEPLRVSRDITIVDRVERPTQN